MATSNITWNGRPILHEDHKRDLEAHAAIGEFLKKQPQLEAEKLAYEDYKKSHHLQAAAHHLQGMRSSQASGDNESSAKHGAMYALHVKQLGLDPYGPVPPEIQTHVADPKREKIHKFKAHRGDSFLLQPEVSTPKPAAQEPVAKSEEVSMNDFVSELLKTLKDLI